MWAPSGLPRCDITRPRLRTTTPPGFQRTSVSKTEQTPLDLHFPNHKVVQLCFAREADDACTGICRTSDSASPESPSIFPVFHRNIHHRFPLSRNISNYFGALSTHFAAHSPGGHCTFGASRVARNLQFRLTPSRRFAKSRHHGKS